VKKLILIAIGLALCAGCVAVDHATVIDTTKIGDASGQYRDARHGTVSNFGIFGSGAGVGGADAAGLVLNASGLAGNSGSSSSGGGGMLGLRVYPAPTQGDPLPFARSIAMINYSKKLKSIKYDEFGGVMDYEFESQPVSYVQTTPQVQTTSQAPTTKLKRRSSFGHQPVE
jgi:hypothetical protein